ncbi:MAG TPA: hypothetical protein PLP50_04950 [Thermoanaerobaculia bacterium]|nr:hypothetical protein [Thermoanaerobaculia bacterium]HPA50933.1 hypothetical protein [Thermoanaerobaculia bacterium]HQN08308.1 hypothetical protein [Thermoanaerobaculia bacterium]HQP88667.1 hypothetical protein [Thermoanaerobaculia bacterium]
MLEVVGDATVLSYQLARLTDEPQRFAEVLTSEDGDIVISPLDKQPLAGGGVEHPGDRTAVGKLNLDEAQPLLKEYTQPAGIGSVSIVCLNEARLLQIKLNRCDLSSCGIADVNEGRG